MFEINFSVNTPTSVTIEVIDLVGRIVYSNSIKNATQGAHKQVVSGIEAGLYTVVLRTPHEVQTVKVIGLR